MFNYGDYFVDTMLLTNQYYIPEHFISPQLSSSHFWNLILWHVNMWDTWPSILDLESAILKNDQVSYEYMITGGKPNLGDIGAKIRASICVLEDSNIFAPYELSVLQLVA